MHFAYPPRKNSNPPPFHPSAASKLPLLRPTRSRTLILLLLGAVFVLYLLLGRAAVNDGYSEREPAGNPPAVIVTVVDPRTQNSAYLETIRENREQYAALHGES